LEISNPSTISLLIFLKIVNLNFDESIGSDRKGKWFFFIIINQNIL